MTITDALGALPLECDRIAIDVTEIEGQLHGIVWDRTGLEDDDGEWGQQGAEFIADNHSDIEFSLSYEWDSGDGWSHYSFPECEGDLLLATRHTSN